ncbi:MAG: aminotransferase class I/II-fold pyridoxal phosphate-dependent enzyme, partial [Planifilum fulgidum]
GNVDKRQLQALGRLMSHTQYGIFYPIQKAAEAALDTGDAFIRRQVETYQARRDALVERLAAGGWEVAKPPATMYVWAKIPEGWSSESFVFRVLEETGVVLTPGRAFGEKGEGYVRITLVQPEDRLKEAADRIGRFLEGR